jgi:tetratricopeptide (TPR) repeat protein
MIPTNSSRILSPYFYLCILFAALILLVGCTANQIATFPPGSNINDVRKSLGKEKTTISYPEYMLFVYETMDPDNYTVLKFENGTLTAQGLMPKWVVNSLGKSGESAKMGAYSYYSMARRLQKQKLNKDAYTLMRRYGEDNPDSGMAITYLGQLYLNDSLLDSAVLVYENALRGEKRINVRSSLQNNELALFIRARQYRKAEEFGKALLADSTVLFKHGIHYNMACIYSIQNKKTEAILQLKEILQHLDSGFNKKQLDDDKDLDNIRKEPGYLEIYKQLPAGKKSD